MDQENAFSTNKLMQQQFELQEACVTFGDFNQSQLHAYNNLLEEHAMFDSKLLLVNHKGKKNKGETYEQHE